MNTELWNYWPATGSYWTSSLNSLPRKIMDLVFLEAMSKHTRDGKVTGKAITDASDHPEHLPPSVVR